MIQHKAQGTSLAALLARVGALTFWENYQAENVDLKAGLLIAFGFFIGGYFGGPWAQQLAENRPAKGVWNFAGNHWHPATTFTVRRLSQSPRQTRSKGAISPVFISISCHLERHGTKMIK
jgi:hypothetical protein